MELQAFLSDCLFRPFLGVCLLKANTALLLCYPTKYTEIHHESITLQLGSQYSLCRSPLELNI